MTLFACEYCYGAEILLSAAASAPIVVGWAIHKIRRKLENRKQEEHENQMDEQKSET